MFSTSGSSGYPRGLKGLLVTVLTASLQLPACSDDGSCTDPTCDDPVDCPSCPTCDACLDGGEDCAPDGPTDPVTDRPEDPSEEVLTDLATDPSDQTFADLEPGDPATDPSDQTFADLEPGDPAVDGAGDSTVELPDASADLPEDGDPGDSGALMPALGRATPPRIYIIYEPIETWEQMAMARHFQPDMVVRGWFKWYNAADFGNLAWAVDKLHEAGILMQGGVTAAALGRIRGGACENGLDEATFLDYITRDGWGDPELISTTEPQMIDYYHIALQNPAAREYVLGWVFEQIDAGADGMWFDEIQGVFPWFPEGYDTYAIPAFAAFLYDKYVVDQGWAANDSRFESVFGIPPFLLGDSIRNFDYQAWLEWKEDENGIPYAADPRQMGGAWEAAWESPNLLHREWGHSWGTDSRLHDTFQWNAVLDFWEEFVTETREYARRRYDRELIITCNENGVPRPFVDFQQIHNNALPDIREDGRLNSTFADNLIWMEEHVALSEAVAPGKPVVYFVDWPDETNRLVDLSVQDTLAFLYTYIPEAYAAGALFAPPVRGYRYHADDEGVLNETAMIVDHLRRYDPLLFEGSRPKTFDVRVEDAAVAVRVREVSDRIVVHLIDYRPVEETSIGRPLTVHLPSTASYIWTVAPHAPFEQRLTASDNTVVIPDFHYSALLVLENQAARNLGVVLAADGQPISGARVTHLVTRRSALTGGDGTFAFPGAPAGRLSVHAEGYLPDSDWQVGDGLRPGGDGRVVARIEDETGCPVVGAELTIDGPDGQQSAFSDVLGEVQVSLTPGADTRFAARTAAFASSGEVEVQVSLTPGADTRFAARTAAFALTGETVATPSAGGDILRVGIEVDH